MRKWSIILCLLITVAFLVSFTANESEAESLRKMYSRPPSEWPKPTVDAGIEWKELGVLPASPVNKDSLKQLIELGKILFFDTRLSGSGKLSCASCHQPELNWTDGKEKSVGHEGTVNKRNSPSIQNTWFYKKLFWDGRSNSLEDQAFAPINSESEMHGDIRELPRNLRKIKAYVALFNAAFGSEGIDPDRIAIALAAFERTIVSRPSKFDEFLLGNKKALNNEELKGLHLFRTRARCMNCHNGALFSDNQFHNNGFHVYENGFMDSAKFDKGLYNVTHNLSDFGKFKTPSLRDVMKTGPWMHMGQMKTMTELISHYNKGAEGNGGAEKTVKMLFLSLKEQAELQAFLHAISSSPRHFNKPLIPE